MTLRKVVTADKIEILNNSVVQVRNAIQIFEDDVVISSSFERAIIAPGDDYSAQSDGVKVVCQAVHTPDSIAAYNAAQMKTA